MSSARVAAVRSVYRSRAGRGAGERAYAGYLAAMAVVVVVLPVARASVLWLGSPGVASAVASTDLLGVVGCAAGLLLSAAVLLGRIAGPAVGEPHPTAVLLETDLRRSSVLGRAVLAAGSVLSIVLAVVAGGLAFAGGSPVPTAAIAGAAFGAVLGVAWLSGQCLDRRRSGLVAAILGAAAAIGAVVPGAAPLTPGGLLALAVTGREAVGALLALLALAALLLPLALRLLDTASGPALLAHSRRLHSARRSGGTGELAEALSGYRVLPRRGRGVSAVRVAPFPLAVVVRDAVGALRTPERSMVGALALVGAGAALAVASLVPPSLLAVPAAVAGVLAYLGAGVWSDGFRHAAETAGQTAFVAQSPFDLLLLHGALPLVLAVAFAVVGALILSSPIPATALGVAVVAVAARAMDATRGPLPPTLLGPVPLPVGDGAGVVVLLWNVAGALVSAGAAVAVAASPVLLAPVPVIVACCLLVARGRLARA